MDYDVFNGDADGICALVQLRLADPRPDAVCVTGIKRDINLLKRVDSACGDRVTVLDISLEKNCSDLGRLLDAGSHVFYADHHATGDIPVHPQFEAYLDKDPNICTGLIIDRYLEGRYKPWAVVAAFGDNMQASAKREGDQLGLSEAELNQLRLLGICMNYNGYGAAIEDLHFSPEVLYRAVACYDSPFGFMTAHHSEYHQLLDGYQADMELCRALKADYDNADIAVYMLPDETWSRRVSGVFGNQLANDYPERAHAIVSINKQGGYLVSVRAPLVNRTGADLLCSSFSTGGGRAGAAGINHLPIDELSVFIDRFSAQYKLS